MEPAFFMTNPFSLICLPQFFKSQTLSSNIQSVHSYLPASPFVNLTLSSSFLRSASPVYSGISMTYILSSNLFLSFFTICSFLCFVLLINPFAQPFNTQICNGVLYC